MANRGSKKGERRGGRKKGIPNKSRDEARQFIDEVLKKRGGTKFIFEKLAELGEGIEMRGEDGKYYSQSPSPIALKTLAEYRFGKPPQPISGNLDVNLPLKIIEDLR
jgi:hypothetical protein